MIKIHFIVHITQVQKCMLHNFAYLTRLTRFCICKDFKYINAYYYVIVLKKIIG